MGDVLVNDDYLSRLYRESDMWEERARRAERTVDSMAEALGIPADAQSVVLEARRIAEELAALRLVHAACMDESAWVAREQEMKRQGEALAEEVERLRENRRVAANEWKAREAALLAERDRLSDALTWIEHQHGHAGVALVARALSPREPGL